MVIIFETSTKDLFAKTFLLSPGKSFLKPPAAAFINNDICV